MLFEMNVKKVLIFTFLCCIVVAAVIVGVVYGIILNQNLNVGAIVTNGFECPAIGALIFKKGLMNGLYKYHDNLEISNILGGSIADATVATMICEGITCPHSSGLGGGFLLTIYIKEEGIVESLDARETAPMLATKDMFDDNILASLEGGLSVAVPGELKGLWELHQKYGKLPWKDLIVPNIELCRKGHLVEKYLYNSMKDREEIILAEPTLREVFINPETNQVWNEGDFIKRNKLADTLETIAEEGAYAIYNGSLTNALLDDIKRFGGIVTTEDLLNYKVRWQVPEEAHLNNENILYTSPLPGSGPVLTFILNLLKGYDLQNDTLSYHRIVEAFKFGYGRRTLLGDEPLNEIKELVKNLTSSEFADFIRLQINDERTFNDYEYYGAVFENSQDHGTANVCILAPNGDAVVATSTINFLFGSYRSSLGIILNNEMDDFGVEGRENVYGLRPSPANFIIPGNRPLSSMVPSIILNKDGNIKMLIGGAGGSRITTGVAFTIIEHLEFGKNLNTAMKAPRLHHQITPMKLYYETEFDSSIMSELRDKFLHDIEKETSHDYAYLTAISLRNGHVEAQFDERTGGSLLLF